MCDADAVAEGAPWWKAGVLYQVYPRSFADSNGDGVGDLQGVIDHLDHLEWLGVDGIWLSPVTVSPNADWGYDVEDYCEIDPELGDMEDLDCLVAEASRRGIRILLDLVPNHTSDRHPWFVDARSSRSARHRDWYVWADPKQDGALPNNWVSSFGGPAWTLDDETGQYYLNNFLPQQPDLNWWSDEVRSAFDSIIRFWFDRGVAGFRIDCCHMIVKDAALRDNPPATEDDDFMAQIFGQRSVYNSNRPEVHEVIRRWRRLSDSYQGSRVLIGETNVEQLDVMASYYGDGSDELHLAFNFPFVNTPFEASALREVVERTEVLLPPLAWPTWFASNHDLPRFVTRWAKGDPARARLALVVLLALRGTPVLYQGDEIGLADTDLDREDLLDPVGLRFWPAYKGRDAVRTPMPWRNAPGGGFTSPGTRTWLPVGDAAGCNVEDQKDDTLSFLSLARDMIGLRRKLPDLSVGSYRSLDAPDGVWAWRRGERVVVVANMSSDPARLDGVSGVVRVATDRRRDGERLSGYVEVRPWECLVAELASECDPAPHSP